MIVEQKNIKALLHAPNMLFEIPDFQRQYSWDKDNIKNFLDDLDEAINLNKNHFFGSIVYQTRGDSRIIIDGQQRITTILLMITAIYHLVKDRPELTNENNPPERINKDFLHNEYGQGDRLKLKVVTTDNEIFKNIYKEDFDKIDNRQSPLYRAYIFFRDYFEEKIATIQNPDLYQYISNLERLNAIAIILEDKDDSPQQVFESINSTGKRLKESDKIRNFALMLDDDSCRKHVRNNYWVEIEENLVLKNNNKDHIADFFRKLLMSHHQTFIKEGDVHAEFKKLFKRKVSNQKDKSILDAFYQMIVDGLNRYVFLKFNKVTQPEYQHFKDNAFRINFLKIDLIIPFLMKVLERFELGELTSNQVLDIFK